MASTCAVTKDELESALSNSNSSAFKCEPSARLESYGPYGRAKHGRVSLASPFGSCGRPLGRPLGLGGAFVVLSAVGPQLHSHAAAPGLTKECVRSPFRGAGGTNFVCTFYQRLLVQGKTAFTFKDLLRRAGCIGLLHVPPVCHSTSY